MEKEKKEKEKEAFLSRGELGMKANAGERIRRQEQLRLEKNEGGCVLGKSDQEHRFTEEEHTDLKLTRLRRIPLAGGCLQGPSQGNGSGQLTRIIEINICAYIYVVYV